MNVLALASLIICGSSLVFWTKTFIQTRSKQSLVWGIIMIVCCIVDATIML